MQLGKITTKTVSQVSTRSGRMSAIAVLATLLLSTALYIPAAHADDFGDGYSATSPQPGPDNNCNPGQANLTGNFAENPCNWTKDNKSIDYAQQYRAGGRFIKHVSDWWKNQMLPNLQLMTKQINASIVDQTRQLGSMMDTQNVTDVARTFQELELKNKKDMIPNEKTCTAATPLLALGTTTKAAAGISKMFVFAQGARSAGIRLPGEVKRLERIAAAEAQKNQSSVTGNAQAAAPVTKVLSPAQDVKERFENYCKYFKELDINSSDGQIATNCMPENASDAARRMPGADTDIEGGLLRDTIDMSKPEEQAWSKAILSNLTEPKILERLPDGGDNVSGVLKTDQGRESVLQRQYLSSIRKVAYEVIASMIARRTAIPGTDKTFSITVTKPGTEADVSTTNEADGLGTDAGEGVTSNSTPCELNRKVFTKKVKYKPEFGTAVPSLPPEDRKPCGDYAAFLTALGSFESGLNYKALNVYGFAGKYQMGAPKLQDIGYCAKGGTIVLKITQTKNGPIKQKVCGTWTPFVQQKYGVTNINDFLANKNDVQEQAIKTAMIAVDNEQKGKKKNDDAFLGQSLAGAPITKSGMLTAAHLVGAAGFRCSLKGRCTGSLTGTINGYRIAMDGNKVYATMYLNIFNGFEVPYANGSGWSDKNTVSTTSPAMNEMSGESDNGGNSPGSYTPVPGKTEIVQVTVSNQIADIRKKAGVHIQDISAQPSYNEIMTAMTKERFFNPEYYASMANDLGAILQEQTVVKSYISIQLEDINRLQEQINALLAARASLKLNGQSMPDLSNKSPVKSQ